MYSPVFILAKSKLLDGVSLHFALQDKIRDLKWSKTNSRGKVKYKSKTKTVHNLLIKMSFPKTRYRWNGETKEGLVIKKHRDHYEAKMKLKIKKVGEHLLSVKYLFEAIQSVYYQFEPTKLSQTNHSEEVVISSEEEGSEDLAPFIWQSSYFDDYDYDSVDVQNGSEVPYEQNENSVFDS